MSNYNRNQKTVYIPAYMLPVWNLMIESCEKREQGAGYVLLESWSEQNGVDMPKYLNKGDMSKLRKKLEDKSRQTGLFHKVSKGDKSKQRSK